MTYGIEFFYHDGTTAVFKLDGVGDINLDNARAIESSEIPGLLWNVWFDNLNVIRRWTISGVFVASNATWSSTTFTGRPMDFMHQLSCALNGVDPILGTKVTGASVGFDLKIHQIINGSDTSFRGSSYRTNELFSQQEIIMLVDKFDFKFKAGVPGQVDYTISLTEVGETIPMG